MSSILNFFATTPKGMEASLAAELRVLGAAAVDAGRAGVAFRGPLRLGYRACLWSRTASRILLPLTRFAAPTPDTLYDGIRAVDWNEHLSQTGSLAVVFNTAQSQITHSQYGAQKVKDAVVDQFRDRFGVRPSVDRERPDLRINVYLFRDQARLSLDLSGESLHRRGYREDGAAAPLKENLAAAILLLAGWPAIAAEGGSFLDPMCGSGTLPIEAALIAADVAPGLLRPYFGFLNWRGHDGAAWNELLQEARERREAGLERLPAIAGSDLEPVAVRSALANLARAGLAGRVRIERRDIETVAPPAGRPGLLAVNPPYGERLGEERELIAFYVRLGEIVRARFPGWRAAILAGNPRLELRLGVSPGRTDELYNGPLECRLLHFELPAAGKAPTDFSPGGEMLANRLRKNLRHLGRWAQRSGIDCYRLYDADLPEYALAVDLYQRDGRRWLHVQEYEAPSTIDPARAEERLRDALAVLPPVLEVAPENLFLKVRRRQKGSSQYERQGETGEFFEVREDGCRYLVNFTDYLDTGLFLDHRPIRRLIHEFAPGKRFLNLFGYTGTATVQAAAGGAAATLTVDMSKTYLEWARRNLALNGFGAPSHELVQADCLVWLEEQAAGACRQFDLIFLDPPTFSNSKRMRATFDVQRDHVQLIHTAARLLAPGGTLLFSTNFRAFRLDAAALADLRHEEITRETIPQDFARNPRIHRTWKMVR